MPGHPKALQQFSGDGAAGVLLACPVLCRHSCEQCGVLSWCAAGRKLPFPCIPYPQSEGLLNNQLPALSVCMKAGISTLLRDVNDSGWGGMVDGD